MEKNKESQLMTLLRRLDDADEKDKLFWSGRIIGWIDKYADAKVENLSSNSMLADSSPPSSDAINLLEKLIQAYMYDSNDEGEPNMPIKEMLKLWMQARKIVKKAKAVNLR